MTDETLTQRLERLVQEQNIPALLTEAQSLLDTYLEGDDDRDLEPILSAHAILEMALTLQEKQRVIDWETQFPVVEINRADLTEFGLTDEQIALFTNEVMRDIASDMHESYFMNWDFWEDFRRASQRALERMKLDTPIAEVSLFWRREFPVLSIKRQDLRGRSIPQEQIESLSDEDMRRIAAHLAEIHREPTFWQSIEIVTKIYLLERTRRPSGDVLPIDKEGEHGAGA